MSPEIGQKEVKREKRKHRQSARKKSSDYYKKIRFDLKSFKKRRLGTYFLNIDPVRQA